MFTISKRPRYVEAAFNKIEWAFSFEDYTIGDLFYVDVLKADGTLLTTLVKNGSGTGIATFDVSSTLGTLFSEVKQYDSSLFMQKDDTALKGYSIKAGYIKLVNRQQVKKHYYTSTTFYVLRAALPFDGSTTMSDLTVNYATQVQFLSDITPSQPSGSNLYLPVLFTAPNAVKVLINYVTEIQTINVSIPAIGVYVFNVKPELQSKAFTNFSVWVEADTAVHTGLYEARDFCTAVGEVGEHQATGVAYSTVSQVDAESLAATQAASIASANLVCELNGTGPGTYTSTQEVTVYCTNGVEGSSTAEATRTSNISQADADQKATDAATALAEANLTCVAPPTRYTANYTYTAYCPEGYSGERTVTGFGESYNSQAEADQNAYNNAKADAEANLVCTLDEPPMQFVSYTGWGSMTYAEANAATTYPSSVYTNNGQLAVGQTAYSNSMGTYKLTNYYYKLQDGRVLNVDANGVIEAIIPPGGTN